MSRFIRLIGLSLIMYLWCSNAMADHGVIRYCDVTADVTFASGVVVDGVASDTESGGLTFDWMHNTPIYSFSTILTDPNGIVCTINGTTSATFDGTNTATVNGTPGYSYAIVIDDNRGPPDSLVLLASITHTPTRRNEGTADFATPRTVVVPAEINVLVGGSGSGWTRLYLHRPFEDDITCHYRGTGLTYGFVRCTDPLDSGFVAGDSLDISHASLRIQQSDRDLGTTVVEAALGTGEHLPGSTPDTYSILIADPAGTIIYDFAANVIDGDISIIFLGDKPVPLP
jgi:hypothetical protein